MSKNALHITLHSTISENDQNGESILQKIQAVRRSVAQLRDTNLDLERIRDQYIIHLQQCQEDHSILRQIYKKLKMKLDMSTQEIPAQSAQSQGAQAPQQIVAAEQPPQGQTSTQSAVPAKRMPTIEAIKLHPNIQKNSANSPNVTLRYALSTTTVICTVQFSSDGTKFAFADGNYVYIINTEDGEIFSLIELKPPPDPATAHTRTLKFSPKDDFLAVSGSNNDVLLYVSDRSQYTLIHNFTGHQKEVSSIVFNEDGSWLISGGFDGVIYIWNTKTYEEVMKLNHPQLAADGTIVGISTTPEIPFYAIGFSNGSIGIYDGQFTPPMTSFPAHNQTLMNLSVSPFDDTIATVSQDNTVKVWMMRGVASCKHTLEGHTDYVLSATFSPNAPILFTGSKDQSIKMWQHKTGEAFCTINAHHNTIFQIDHHPKSNTFVSCSGEGVVCLWDYKTQ